MLKQLLDGSLSVSIAFDSWLGAIETSSSPSNLQSNQVKRTPLDSINESIIWKLKPLVVSSIQIKIRFLIGLYEQCMKPQNQ